MTISPNTPGIITAEAQARHIKKCAKLKEQGKLKPLTVAHRDDPFGTINPAYRKTN